MSSLLSSNSKSILNAHIDNLSSAKSSIGLKISGKGLNDTSNTNNIYDNNGIGFQLLSNVANYKELAIIDTSNNINNNNYSSLRIAITESSVNIKSITSNNNYKSLIINSNFIISSNGQVGIGTTNPISTLDIRGNLTLDGYILNTTGALYYNANQWNNTTIGSNIYYNIGFIGVGTTNPLSQIHLASPLASTAVNMRFTDATTGNTINDGFIIGKDGNQNGIIWNYENNSIVFGTLNQERLRITNTGRIGIGTTNPQSALDIRGDLTFSGSILKPDGSVYYNNN